MIGYLSYRKEAGSEINNRDYLNTKAEKKLSQLVFLFSKNYKIL